MRQLDHPNIIKLVDFSESRQYYYIVLELAPGGELFHQIVRLTYFSEELSRHVIVQVAKALEYLHEEKGVVHRYVNPPALSHPYLVRHATCSRGAVVLSSNLDTSLTRPQRHQA
jgi:serine/threonine protein kinase